MRRISAVVRACCQEICHEPNRLLIRTASNAYFPQIMSVISLPDRNQELREAVEQVWDFISEVKRHRRTAI